MRSVLFVYLVMKRMALRVQSAKYGPVSKSMVDLPLRSDAAQLMNRLLERT